MKTRIMYLRDSKNPNGRGNPIGCLAIGLDSLDRPTEIKYQLSVLNPIDTFNKKIAHTKAVGRLVSKPFVVKSNLGSDFSCHEVASTVMSDLKNNHFVPTRARKAAEAWLNNSSKLQVPTITVFTK